MARLGWGGSVAIAIGVAAAAGAAQLGFGYGLGIINWTPAEAATVEAAWVASLAWATWISATSVVAGAVCAQRLRARGGEDEEPGGTLGKITLAVAGAVGALITVLLVAVPARAARVPDTFSPQTVAAGYAAVGLLVGVVVATWALHSRAAATNLIATTGWLWLLAVVSVVDSVLAGRGLTSAQLGIWQISADSERFWIRDYFYWPGALLAMGSALVIGVLAARRTARLPERRVGAAASGAAGPLLVAVAYLLAVPRLAAIAAEQVSAHLIAPYAVLAGVGGSVLVAALAQRAERRNAARAGVILPRQRTAEHDDLSTGTGRGTLDLPPAGDAPENADAATGTGEPAAGGRTGRSSRRPAAGATRGAGAAGATGTAAGLTVAEPATSPGPATGAASNRPATRRGRAQPPERGAAATGPAASGPDTGTASDRNVPPAGDAGSAEVPAAPDTASADVPAKGEAGGPDQPGSGPTTAPTTGPKTRPGRRGR
ncbi:hypothetical protein [Micromonospora inositola]|uniref:Uncharacterized protein n=1 Tax=Micromonospora inositola TaxID=47865 RepID=A0A1C5HTY7_9ACTN|nr:hypothetical protein [Micromonospora inositola]SCG49486.1 hypothetical protein GA0070613_1819 [Micromonospora inositola]